MRKIVLGFSRPIKLSIFAKAIMWADNLDYDHVYVKWTWNSIERDIIYQASKLAVNFESNVTFDGHAVAVEEYELEISDECFKNIMQFCMDNSNKPYGIKEIIGFVWVKLLGFVGIKTHNPFPTHGNSFICSKIGAEVLALCNVVKINQSYDDIDPLALNEIIKTAGIKRTK